MNYKIEVKETLSRIIDIEADNESEAIMKVKSKYITQDIVLDSSDYVDTEINIYQEYDKKTRSKVNIWNKTLD